MRTAESPQCRQSAVPGRRRTPGVAARVWRSWWRWRRSGAWRTGLVRLPGPAPGSATQWIKSTFYWLAPARTSPASSSSPWSNIHPCGWHNHLALALTDWLLLVPTQRPHTLISWSVTSKGCWPSYSLLSNPRVSCAPGLLQLCSRTPGLFTDNIETVT